MLGNGRVVHVCVYNVKDTLYYVPKAKMRCAVGTEMKESELVRSVTLFHFIIKYKYKFPDAFVHTDMQKQMYVPWLLLKCLLK